jgi:hypothetical protein
LFEELIWVITNRNIYFDAAIYTSSLIIFYNFKYDKASKAGFLITLICLTCEIYWFYIGYDKNPSIEWFIYYIASCVLIRHLIFHRSSICYNWWPGMKLTRIDRHVYDLQAFIIAICSLNIIEYLVRHLFNQNILVVYTIYPYAKTITSCVLLLLILHHSINSYHDLRA